MHKRLSTTWLTGNSAVLAVLYSAIWKFYSETGNVPLNQGIRKYALNASLRECLPCFSQHLLWLARILWRNIQTEFRNLERNTFKSSLLRGEHGTQNVRVFLRFHVNLLFLVFYIVHLVNGRVCSNFLSALWKNTPGNFSKTTPKQTTLAAFLTFSRRSLYTNNSVIQPSERIQNFDRIQEFAQDWQEKSSIK